jgi:hypothetical protein
MKFITRAYNSFSYNKDNKSTIIKKSSEEKLLHEINYYKNLPENLKVYFPRIIEKNTSVKKPYSLELEYYAYTNLGDLMINTQYNKKDWTDILEFIFLYINNYKLEKSIKSTKVDINKMLIEKTENEFFKLANSDKFFDEFTKQEKIILNGQELYNFSYIWENLKEKILCLDYEKDFYFIHGDLCFSNILYSKNPINNDAVLKFIDPRGTFGSKDYYGDLYYDLAKLSHSINGGYEYIIYDQFELNIENNKVELVYKNDNKDKIYDIFEEKIISTGYNPKIITMIEGLIYIGMCARHYDSKERQKVMYLTGVKLLNEFYEEI